MQTYRVEALALHHVGVFDDVELKFKPIASAERDEKKAEIHIFTGPNGCGKSTLLCALAGIFNALAIKDGLIQRRFWDAQSAVDFLFSKNAGRIGVCNPGSSPQLENCYGNYQPLINDSSRGVFYGGCQEFSQYAHLTYNFRPELAHSQARFSYAAFAYSGQRTLEDMQLTAIQPINNSPFENALSFHNGVRPQVLLQWIANNRTQSALAKQDGDTQAAQLYDEALGRITGLIRDVCDLEVEFRLERSPLAVTVSVNNLPIRFDVLPDGLKSIISWVGDLSLRLEAIPWQESHDVFSQPIILLLDEVDIHLHPRWQRRILPAIQKLLPNAQIFVSTHSPFVVGSVEDAWVYRLPDPGQGTAVIEGERSRAGDSYRLILEEVFGIDKEFDVETEKLFSRFYQQRTVLLSEHGAADELLDTARALVQRSEEAEAIVCRELRQLSRVLGRELMFA
jgi:hypothetical protein